MPKRTENVSLARSSSPSTRFDGSDIDGPPGLEIGINRVYTARCRVGDFTNPCGAKVSIDSPCHYGLIACMTTQPEHHWADLCT